MQLRCSCMEVVLPGRCSTPCKDRSRGVASAAHPSDASEKCFLSRGMPGQMQGQMQQMQGQQKPSLVTPASSPAGGVQGGMPPQQMQGKHGNRRVL